ncbi:MAG: tetratricopeptide repeat protein [Gemmataceae bacterium]
MEAAASEPTTASPPTAKAAAFSRFAWPGLISGLLALGATIGWLSRPAPPDEEPEQTRPKLLTKDAEGRTLPFLPGMTGPIDVRKGDQLFREGRFDLALLVYRHLGGSPAPVSLVYRQALCQEQLGDRKTALALHHSLVERGDETHAALALLGAARIHLHEGRPAQAKSLLWPLALRSADKSVDQDLRAEVAYTLSLALALEASPAADEDGAKTPLRPDERLAFPREIPWDCNRLLALSRPAPKTTGKREPNVVSVPAKSKVEQTVATAYLPKDSFHDAVKRLASAGELTVGWSPKALRTTEGRAVHLDVSERSLLGVLQGLADAFDLVCHTDGEKVIFTLPEEIPKARRDEARAAMARRYLEETLAFAADHPLAPLALIARANLDAAAPKEALAWLERLAAEHPFSRLNLYADFNRGLHLHREGRMNEARRAFFKAMDQAPSHPQALLACLRLGRMSIEEGEAAQAIALLKRGVAHAHDDASRPPLVTTLAIAYVLDDDLPNLKTLLGRHRDVLQDDLHAPFGNLLTAYARFRDAKTKKSVADSHDLLYSLLALRKDNPLGPLGLYVAGLGYSDLALWPQAAAAFKEILPATKGPLQHEAALRLAEALLRQGDAAEARKYLESIAAVKTPAGPWARFRLARLDLDEGKTLPCLERSRLLLHEPSNVPHVDILRLMGEAYERRREHDKAAKCFAGECP